MTHFKRRTEMFTAVKKAAFHVHVRLYLPAFDALERLELNR